MEDLIPFVAIVFIFGGATAIILYAIYSSFKAKQIKAELRTRQYELIEKIAAMDKVVPTELLSALEERPTPKSPHAALRNGLINLFGGIGVFFGLFYGLEPDDQRVAYFALIPACVGIGYFIIYLFEKGKNETEADHQATQHIEQ